MSKSNALECDWSGAPTPSPLRRMEEPLPSCLVHHDMAPPKPKPPAIQGKRILDEEDYVNVLERIIGRDYFPDVPRLKEQLKWLEGVNPHDATLAKRIIMSEQRSWDVNQISTPYRWHNSEVAHESDVGNVSLSSFLSNHTSEDNESFQQLLHKMQEAHRRSHWWAYEGAAASHLLLHNGERVDEARQIQMELAAAAKPRIDDDRPGAIESWPYRSKNAFMFEPELADSYATCGVNKERMLIIESSKNSNSQISGLLTNGRVGVALKAPPEIQKKSTRFCSEDVEILTPKSLVSPSPLEKPNSERSSVRDINLKEGIVNERFEKCNEFVPMTPVILPGAGGESPVMTWGNIQGTPIILDGNSRSGTMEFGLHEQPPREALAHRLDTSKRLANSRKHMKSPHTILSSISSGRKATPLTPAAQSLAKRLGKGVDASPFGGNLGRFTPTNRSVGREGGTRTPLSTPNSAVKRQKRSAKEPRKAPTSKSLTDGLLEL